MRGFHGMHGGGSGALVLAFLALAGVGFCLYLAFGRREATATVEKP